MAEDTETLRGIIVALLNARRGEREHFMSLAQHLVLPEHQAWFESVFGSELGSMLGHEYGALLREMDSALPDIFGRVIDRGLTEVHVKCIEGLNDPDATGAQRDAMCNMRNPVKLYTVRFVRPGETMGISLWSFVYDKGDFRFIGKMNALQ